MRPRFDDLARQAAAAFISVDDAGDAAERNLAVARRMALPALTVPEDLGGMGANLLDFASYQQLLARRDGATALVLAMHHMLLGGEAESGAWPSAQWLQLCRSVVDAGILVNSAATEPGAGTPSAGGLPATVARPESSAAPAGSTWRLTGRKAYTTGAPFLGVVRVSARVEPEGEEPYGARFMVRLPAEGTTMQDTWRPAALGAAGNDDIVMEGTPATFLYREDGRGCEGTVWFQVAIAATYLGIGYTAFEQVLAFTRDRVTAAGPVSDRESVRLRLGRTRAVLEVARRNLLATCATWVEWNDVEASPREAMLPDVGLAKLTAVNAAAAAAEEAVRLAGAGGFGAGQPFARLLLETRAGLSHPPIEDVALLRLAERDLA
ncbi:MAG: acyl-CoA dehydrogenase family protein [Candidatus Dormibacteria bacterium]